MLALIMSTEASRSTPKITWEALTLLQIRISPSDTNVLGLTRAMVKPKFLNFAPRIGFNYVPFSNGNTDIKGGFGIYYIQPNINQYEVEVDTTKYYLIQSYNNSTATPPPGYIVSAANPGPPTFTLDQLFGPTVKGGGPTASFIQPDGMTPILTNGT